MLITRAFKSGNSQAVRIPKEFQFHDEDLYINKVGSALVIFPKKNAWELFEQGLSEFSGDFLEEGRRQPEMQKRPSFDGDADVSD
jgi:antitoxin VapB